MKQVGAIVVLFYSECMGCGIYFAPQAKELGISFGSACLINLR